MKLNNLEHLKILLQITNGITFIDNTNIKEQIHNIQNTQDRWNSRKEKRRLQNLIIDSEFKKNKRRL